MANSPEHSRPTARRTVVLGLVPVVVVVLGAAWVAGFRATLQLDAVTGVPHCNDTEPSVESDPGDSFQRVSIPTTAGFTCTLSIRFDNRSDHDIRLDRATVPLAGPMARTSFEILRIDGDEPAEHQIDAIVDLDRPIESGDTYVVEMQVGFRESGCASEGSWTGVDPRIKVQDLIASHDLVVTDLPLFAGTADSHSSCGH